MEESSGVEVGLELGVEGAAAVGGGVVGMVWIPVLGVWPAVVSAAGAGRFQGILKVYAG